jgi:RNase adaptor protein for sRNA GlmZ degradation
VTTAAAGGPAVEITSFGYLHGRPPRADLTVDLREGYRDPHVDPALRELTAADPRVTAAVLATPGVPALIRALAAAVRDLLGDGGPVTAAIGCAGGRHRSAVVAVRLATALEADGVPATTVHRDIDKPVVRREAREEG